MQEENDNLTDLLKNNLTVERNYICNNFSSLRKKILEENKAYNESTDIFLAHLIGLKKAMQILKNFYNLTTLSTLFLQFQNSVKTHQNILMTQTAKEIKEIVQEIRQKIDIDQTLEEQSIFDVFKTHAKKNSKKDRKKLLTLKEDKNFNFTGKDIQIILTVYKNLSSLLDLMQNTTIYLTNYHNSIIEYYDAELKEVERNENITETTFNGTMSQITNNTLLIKDYAAKINNCIGKAIDEKDCDPIKEKSEELKLEVEEFLKILEEIIDEFNKK